MAKYILDTTELIKFLRGDKGVAQLLKKLVSEGHTVGCCGITVGEIYYGMKDKEKILTDNLIDNLFYYNISKESAKLAGIWKRDYKNKGITLTFNDVMIAATACVEGAILITSNTKDFPMKEIIIFK
jgi:predicted nucleic acid-binding protein